MPDRILSRYVCSLCDGTASCGCRRIAWALDGRPATWCSPRPKPTGGESDGIAASQPVRWCTSHARPSAHVPTASDEYSKRMHNLCCDNCHSHVAMALELMRYNGRTYWNMFMLTIWMFVFGRYTGCVHVFGCSDQAGRSLQENPTGCVAFLPHGCRLPSSCS